MVPLLGLLFAAGFTPPPAPHSRCTSARGLMPRRELLLSTTLGAAALVRLPRPAAAQVDGIPLYAPSGSAPLPTVGFEKLLPALETRIDDMGARRLAAGRGDWSGVVALVTPEEVVAQGKLFGSLAAILGDDAYTVLSLKGKYLASLKKLTELKLVAGTPPSATVANDAMSRLDEMSGILTQVKTLVPEAVVAQVSRRAAPPPPLQRTPIDRPPTLPRPGAPLPGRREAARCGSSGSRAVVSKSACFASGSPPHDLKLALAETRPSALACARSPSLRCSSASSAWPTA